MFSQVGDVKVVTSSDGGLPVEHWAERLLVRIVSVSEESDPEIKQKALAFKEEIHQAILHYMKAAVESDRNTRRL
jgi:hypothetical protein